MSSFLFEGAFTRLASLDAADYSNLRIALVESAPTVTDEFAADLDETAAANYARKTPTGGALTQTAGKTLVTGTIPTWSALGTAETLTHWVLLYNTGSDATSWLIAAVALGHTCDGGDLTISTSGFLVDPTITRALGGSGGTAADITYDDTGNAILTPAATVQAALDGTDFLLANFAFPSFQDLRYIEAYTGSGTYTVTGDKNTVTLDLTGDLEVTLPTPASSGRTLWLIVNASAADRDLSFATTVQWLGDTPGTIPSETGRLILLKWGGGPEVSGSGWWGVDFYTLVGGLSAPVALLDLATQADLTLVGNNSGGTAAPTALTASAVRTLLALGGAALLNVGTTAGTVAAGDDSRITGAVPKSTVTTAGDLIAATGSAAVDRIPVASSLGQTIIPKAANSTKWATGYPSDLRRMSLLPSGVIAASYLMDEGMSSSGSAPSSGRLYFAAVALQEGRVIAGVTWAAVGASSSITNQWSAIYDSSGNKLAVSTDATTTAWSANSMGPTHSISYTTTTSGLFYICLCLNGSGLPTIANKGNTNGTAVNGRTPMLSGRSNDSSLTNPASAPSTFGSPYANTSMFYVELS